MISIKPNMKAAYQLLHDGALVLAEIERTGIRIDCTYCERQGHALDRRIARLTERMMEDPDVKEWRRLEGVKFNLDSPVQLSRYLFNHKGLESVKETAKGNASVDDEALGRLDVPFIKTLLAIRKLKKAKGTYLEGILSGVSEDGLLHPFFNLHTVATFRSSSQNPNFQNIPIRDPDVAKLVRRAFIPRPGHQLGGVDFAAIEVKISLAYHQDPVMLEYINNPAKDMHRDMAMECYLLEQGYVNKQIRYCAKNKFVFPQFYGDWYKSCAKSLWDAIPAMKLARTDGMALKEHLREQGIRSYQEFENHIHKVEDRFWNDRFRVYQRWKDRWLKQYERTGKIHMLTGFTCSGVMQKNQVINYCVQGVAFHCLLWSLIRLHGWMKEQGLRSRIVGQIHDEITMDNHAEEMEIVLKQARQIMCEDIRKEWKWIVTPLEIEAEFAPVDRSWYEKASVKIGG